ncbi:MAG: RdgB/HAM1 family non-canonical purine NTP pyrophosphatase [Methylacidiphilales bacterium]|nr:RdgB/HAM1 family non-canonical purine NTP pyrophosphatase [Candidatus Methylacidiphilales bacterium]MDW8349575.1 RdgB/HAM1 family non-canonical purine NTP pyrophosphatase [Verrucomicrobiae bacterium]
MKRIVIATTSTGKGKELRARLASEWVIWTLQEAAQYWGEYPDVKEEGETFMENARGKAVAYSLWAKGEWVLADDSGLCVDALRGAPGVRSARYAGEPRDDGKNLELVLDQMRGVKNRAAAFYCALVLAKNGEVVAEVEGRCHGTLALSPRGTHGFGYDPIFIPEGYSETFGELPESVKARISHRAKALESMVEILKSI